MIAAKSVRSLLTSIPVACLAVLLAAASSPAAAAEGGEPSAVSPAAAGSTSSDRALSLLAALAGGNGASGAGEASVAESAEGLSYLVGSDGTATVVGYSGAAPELAIPETLDGHTVTAIADGAFRGNAALTGVAVPGTVKSIGSLAFAECPQLAVVMLPEGLAYLGAGAFYDDDALVEVVLPASLVNCGTGWGTDGVYGPFGSCDGLAALELAEGATAVPAYLLVGCAAPVTVTLPATVSSIGPDAFDPAAGITLRGMPGSLAQTYAEQNGLAFESIVVAATAVALDQAQLEIVVDKTARLTAAVEPADCTEEPVWSSANPDVASVDAEGLVTARAAGTTEVAVTVGAFSAACQVTVIQPVESIALNKKTVELEATETRLLRAEVLPQDATNKDLVWTSSDEGVVRVDAAGRVVAVGKGTATITATAADGFGAKASCTVTVTNDAVIATSVEQLASGSSYGNDKDDIWLYTLPGASAISVTFDARTCVEDGYDFIDVYDGQGRLFGRYTGTALAGKSLVLEGDTVKIKLVTDASTTEWGFGVTAVTEVKTSGWVVESGVAYYYIDGAPARGELLLSDGWHYFNENTGAMITGLITLPDGRIVYYDQRGVMQTGEVLLADGWHYFDPATGAMAIGFTRLPDGRCRYYDHCGVMRTGDVVIDNRVYHFDQSTGILVENVSVEQNVTNIEQNITNIEQNQTNVIVNVTIEEGTRADDDTEPTPDYKGDDGEGAGTPEPDEGETEGEDEGGEGEQAPAEEQQPADEGEQQPAEEQGPAGEDEQTPAAEGEQEPAEEQQPAGEGEQEPIVEQEPADDGQRPADEGGQQPAEEQQPEDNEPQPEGEGGQQPAEEQQPAGEQQPASEGEQEPAGEQQHAEGQQPVDEGGQQPAEDEGASQADGADRQPAGDQDMAPVDGGPAEQTPADQSDGAGQRVVPLIGGISSDLVTFEVLEDGAVLLAWPGDAFRGTLAAVGTVDGGVVYELQNPSSDAGMGVSSVKVMLPSGVGGGSPVGPWRITVSYADGTFATQWMQVNADGTVLGDRDGTDGFAQGWQPVQATSGAWSELAPGEFELSLSGHDGATETYRLHLAVASRADAATLPPAEGVTGSMDPSAIGGVPADAEEAAADQGAEPSGEEAPTEGDAGIEGAVGDGADRPVGQPVEQPEEQSTDQPAEQPAEQEPDPTGDGAAGEAPDSIDEGAGTGVDQPTGQPGEQPADQPADQSAEEQPAEQEAAPGDDGASGQAPEGDGGAPGTEQPVPSESLPAEPTTAEVATDVRERLECMAAVFIAAACDDYGTAGASDASGNLVAAPGYPGIVDTKLVVTTLNLFPPYLFAYASASETLTAENPFGLDYYVQDGMTHIPLATVQRILQSFYGTCPEDLSYIGDPDAGIVLEFTGEEWVTSGAGGVATYSFEAANMVVDGSDASFDCIVTFMVGTDYVSSKYYHVTAVQDEASMFGYHLVSVGETGPVDALAQYAAAGQAAGE